MHKFRQKYIGDKAFYKRYLMLAIPMIIQNAITNLVSFLDNIMVGQLGTEQMSGVAIVNQLIFVYNLAVFGAVSAASIFGAQYFGKGNHKGHMYSFRFKLYAALLVTAIAMTLFITNGTGFISLYLTDTAGNGATEVALAYGKEYLEIVMIGLIPFAVTQAYATNIKETGQTFVPMVASFAAVGSNAVLDFLLIFGIGPIPKLGVAGAAIATVMSRYIETIIVVLWAHKNRDKNRYLEGAYRGIGMPFGEFKTIFIKGLPLMLNELFWAAGMTTVTQCYSVRGLSVIAGLNIATTITNLFNIVFIQLGACISIVVGQYLGAGEAERLDNISREELSGMLYENSDEPYCEEIAKAITDEIRKGNRIDTTTKLRHIIEQTLDFLPEKDKKDIIKKTCQRTFQALRIDVNHEFEVLYEFMEKLPGALKPGGRAAILTFHSGEDKLVKKALKAGYKAGIYSDYSKDVIRPSAQECAQNGRARSTKMRWAVRAE